MSPRAGRIQWEGDGEEYLYSPEIAATMIRIDLRGHRPSHDQAAIVAATRNVVAAAARQIRADAWPDWSAREELRALARIRVLDGPGPRAIVRRMARTRTAWSGRGGRTLSIDRGVGPRATE